MPDTTPRDIIEQYAVGNATVSAYQTTGVDPDVKSSVAPTRGQADSYAVVASARPVDEPAMSRIMDGLSNLGNGIANGDMERGSTGALVSVGQIAPKEAGGASFDIVAGARGDSRTFVASVDVQGNVSMFDVNKHLSVPDQFFASQGFGAEGEPGANPMHTHRLDIQKGEQAFVITVSDGVIDPYLMAARNKTAGGSIDSYVNDMRADLEAYIKANPQSQDVSRFVAERAVAMGSQDNTTVTSMQLTSETDLGGKSATMGVFDGSGHENGTLSSALANQLPKEVPGAEPTGPVMRQELDHVATRAADLARVATPGAVDPHADNPGGGTAKKGPGNVGEGGGGVKTTAPKQPDPPPPPLAVAKEKPVVTERTPAVAKGNGAPTSKFAGGAQTKAGHGVGVGQVAVDLAAGRYKEAGENAAMQVALNPKTYQAAATLTEEAGTVARGLGFFAKKVPIVGAIVTAGFVAYEVGDNLYQGKSGKALAAAGAGLAEIGGNIVGFGVGDAAREGVREGIVRTAGEDYAPNKSGIRTLVEQGIEVGSKFVSGDKQPAATEMARNQPPPIMKPGKPPGMG